MRLYSVTVEGYKRFSDAWMNLEGSVVALVGPNEAGKSSILEALSLLNDDNRVPATKLTRDEAFGEAHEVIWARFRLSADERRSGPLPLWNDEGIWLIVAKTIAGPRRYRLDPSAQRDRSARRAAASALSRAVAQPWFGRWGANSPGDAERPGPGDLARVLSAELANDVETLPADTIARVKEMHDQLELYRSGGLEKTKTARAGIEKLASALGEAHRIERNDAPESLAQALAARVPRFIDFNDENRDLRSEYNLGDATEISRPALRNFAAMADLPLEVLRDAISAGDTGQKRTILEKAQNKLAEKLKDAWKQSPLTVSFDRDGTALSITVSSHGDDYFSLDARSAGMRTFIALRAFLAQGSYEVPPVLLVDEAETHLHYDAQADLIRVFEEQDVVAQVVYTTHSIGCLPQDLGRGVRVVVPVPESTRSNIENVWCREDAGVSPLMLAMGASTLPLAPSRYVVIGEGASDAMLLPSLLREATGLSTLQFQVVSGLSSASESDLTRLDKEAQRVAYLVDGDIGGADIAARLKRVKVAPRKIVKLARPSTGTVIEDLLDPELYASAVDQYVSAWPPYKGGFPRTLLRKRGRPAAVDKWCEANDIPKPSKLRVVEEVLRILSDPNPPPKRVVADTSRISLLRGIHDRLLAALDL